MAGKRYKIVAEKLDTSDPDAVAQWAYGVCLEGPLAGIAPGVELADVTEELVIARTADAIPQATRQAAVDGCRRGLAERDDELGRVLRSKRSAPAPD
jgi:hypothetical protein